MPTRAPLSQTYNHARFVPGQRRGHYESFYQRGNHPTRPLAFWIRYTVFSPQGRPQDAIGELWAVVFDGETGQHVVAKEEHPIAETALLRDGFGARVAGARLAPGELSGQCSGPASTIDWDLRYDGGQDPLYLLPRRMYDLPFPKAKSLVGVPLVTYHGRIRADGREFDVDGWVGSQNHNWGSKHTDHYAFAQVAGFDDAPDSFLEVVSARVRVGPVRTPMLTFLVLRHDGREYAMTSLRDALRARASFGFFHWDLDTAAGGTRVRARVSAPAQAFVGLNYYNPPGGIKHCLNTKIGACELTLSGADGTQVLRTRDRALFEILTDERDHGIPIRA